MADATERLLLQVDASIELLRRELAAGEQPMDRLERRAASMAGNVDRSIGNMGSRFGDFARLADDAAKQAERSFTASYQQIQRIAGQSMKGPTIAGGANLGIDDLRAQQAAAAQQAQAYRLIGEAAERAAAKNRDTSEATRLFIQATAASRIEAEQAAAALAQEAGALERVQIELMQSAEAAELFVTRHQRVAEAAAEERRLAAAADEAARSQHALAAAANALRTAIDPMYVAQQRFDMELTRAETLLAAGVISQREYAAAVGQARSALQQLAAQLSGATDREEQLAIATSKAAAAEERMTNEVHQLRAALDPMFAAQQRFDNEMDRAERLLAAGAITTREYANALLLARTNLYDHARAIPTASQATARLTEEQRRAMAAMQANRFAMQGLSYQAQDTFTQLSMGANIFNVIAIQGAQAAGQLSFLQGATGSLQARAAKFAQFMLGPWGLAITAGLMVVGALTKHVDLLDNKLDNAIDKMKRDADQTALTEKAKKRFALSIEGVTAAIAEQTKALDAAARSEESAAERSNIAAKQKMAEALAVRQATAARLAEAVAMEESLKSSPLTNAYLSQNGERDQLQRRITELQAAATQADAAVTRQQQIVNETRVDLAQEAARRATDPIARINRLYDQQAQAAERAARQEARRGAVVDANLIRQLAGIERNRQAELKAEQDRQSAARAGGGAANRQFGREIDVAGARQIIASLGGRVTSATRSRAEQERLWAEKQAGRHNGPVAKPGTSSHEHGQALDVAYGPGISVASIRKAFNDAGVRLRKILNEPGQRVFHVEWGKAGRAGPSAETLQRRAVAAERKELRDENAFGKEILQARRKIMDATARTATTAEREALAQEEINAEAETERLAIGNRLKAGDLTVAEALHLSTLNETIRKERLRGIEIDRATRQIDRQYDAMAEEGASRLDVLRIQQETAATERDRRRIAREILDLEQQMRRQALERVRDSSQDPDAVLSAKRQLDRLPEVEQAEDKRFDQQAASPFEQYRDRLKAATSDTTNQLQAIAVDGFGRLEEAGSRAAAQAVTDLLGIGGVAGEVIGGVIQDLARLAIQKAVVAAIGGGVFGFADGGPTSVLPGFARGGSLARVSGFAGGGSPGGLIRGPGNARSDSILAMLSNGKGAIRVSNKEFIVNGKATEEWLPELAAINSGKLRKYANGGLVSPSMPRLREPRPNMARLSSARDSRLQVDTRVRVEGSDLLKMTMQETAVRTVGAAAEPIMAGAQTRTLRRMARTELPGGWG